MQSSPHGTTIRLKTNALIPIPDDLEITKGISLEPGKGFKPQIGRVGADTTLTFVPGGQHRTVSIRGIVFRQVEVRIQFDSGTGHKAIFADNRLTLDSGSNGSNGLSINFNSSSSGSLSVRDNVVSSSGTGIDVRPQGGPVTISGNRVTAPDNDDSQGGISVLASGSGRLRTTVANNVIHHVSGCNCGTPAGLQVRAFVTVTLDIRILGNTIDAVGLDSTHQGYSIMIVSVAGSPLARIEASFFNNLVTDAKSYGIVIQNDDQIEAVGNRNAVFGAPNGNSIAAYDIGTILTDDPIYVNAAAKNYRLGPGSPYANAGQTCIASMPLPRGDAAGKFRIAHGSVDVGAYERGSGVSAGVKGKNLSGTNGRNTIVGTPYRDVLCGLGGPDTIKGGAGVDLVIGGAGADRASGGAGNDRIDTRDGVAGNDRALGGPGNDTCLTDAGDVRRSC